MWNIIGSDSPTYVKSNEWNGCRGLHPTAAILEAPQHVSSILFGDTMAPNIE